MPGIAVQQMDISSRLGIRTTLQSMLFVIQNFNIDRKLFRKSTSDRIDRSVSNCIKAVLCAMVCINYFDMSIKFTVNRIAQIIHT